LPGQHAQANENLERQVGRVCGALCGSRLEVELYKEIASGFSTSERTSIQELLKTLFDGNVARVVVEFKDRIARFGLQMFTEYCEKFGVELVILKQGETKEFEQEMVDDIVMIMTSYSARLYGRRGGKRRKADQSCVK
jgi:predicted site-specific integrase-resolvase